MSRLPPVEWGGSKRQLDKAGELLRRHRAGELEDPADIEAALRRVEAHRQMWQTEKGPVLTGVVMGLKSMARNIGCDAAVSQRLKRVDRLIGKLVRKPGMKLSRMADVGGARAVVESLEDLRRLEGRLRRQWAGAIRDDCKDYIVEPRKTGYRAVHLHVLRRGLVVEVQLRTKFQHQWASWVERMEFVTGQPLKDELGDPARLDFLRALSDLLAFLDREEPVPEDLFDHVSQLSETMFLEIG